MKYILYFCLLLTGCNHAHLIVNHPTVRIHAKGHNDNINGAAITVRVRWDVK